MSSYLCTDLHILTVAHGLEQQLHTNSRPHNQAFCLGLKVESLGYKWLTAAESIKLANLLAIKARYNAIPCEADLVISDKHQEVSALQMIKLITCIVYQCGEFSSTDTSKDAEFVRFICDNLKQYKESIITKLTDRESWDI